MSVPIYGDDLAYVHDAGFSAEGPAIARELVRRLGRRGIRDGLIVELGCGSGRLARELLEHGFDVLGIDSSPHMLRLARVNAPGAAFARGSLHEWRLPACVSVIAVGESICYAGADRPPPAMAPLFRRVARALQPGGLFVFDAIVAGRPRMAYRTWRAGDDWAVLAEVRERSAPAVVERDIVAFRRVGRTWRRSRERHAAGVYARGTLFRQLRAAGFQAVAVTRFGRYQLAPRRLAFIAASPAA